MKYLPVTLVCGLYCTIDAKAFHKKTAWKSERAVGWRERDKSRSSNLDRGNGDKRAPAKKDENRSNTDDVSNNIVNHRLNSCK